MRNWMIGLLALVTVTGMAADPDVTPGGRDGAGDLMRPYTPNEDFEYECRLTLENPSQARIRWRSEGTMTLTRKQVDLSWGFIEIPKSAWTKHGTFDTKAAKWEVVPSKDLPPYNLEHHAVGMSFGKVGSTIVAELRVNVIHERFKSGAMASVYSEFSSKIWVLG